MSRSNLNLKTTLMQRSEFNAAVLGDYLASYGIPYNVVHTSQQAYMNGDITGIRIVGYDTNNHIQDEVKLWFNEILGNNSVSVDLNDGRSMIERASTKLATAVNYNVGQMRSRGLGIHYFYIMAPGRNNAQTNARYGLEWNNTIRYQNGHAPRRVFNLSTGSDTGINYSYYRARQLR